MRFLTAGESHGQGLVVIVDGLPRGVGVTREALLRDLRRRQIGYGRGPRASSEPEQLSIIAGVRAGQATGAPISVMLRHRHWETWRPILDPDAGASTEADLAANPDLARVDAFPTRPRPGHADLAGAIKYDLDDLRDVIERASARETAARTVAGTLARLFLEELGVRLGSWVSRIGPVCAGKEPEPMEAMAIAEPSPVRACDRSAEAAMMAEIDRVRAAGDTLGGVFAVCATGIVPGLGSYMQWDRRLDGRLAAAVMSVPGVKGVAFGDGLDLAALPGSAAHDPILPSLEHGYRRPTNRAGGLEGGLTNGEPLLIRAAVKPIPTLYQPLPSIDLRTGQQAAATVERSDVCVVPAAAVVAEAMVAWTLAESYLEKFGGDTLSETKRALAAYRSGPWGRGHA